ncbi:MAG: hypothetical protein J6N44_03545 [Acidaminococcaceae bacterium]|nr:hypothetical protein [Acidaminococcaceae bacterium]
MKELSIDLETYSSESLLTGGVYRYTEAPDFGILLFGYSIDGGEPQVVDVAAGEQIPADIIAALSDSAITKWAFNAAFERVCLSRFLGTYLKPEGWHCSMVWAATLGLPLSLEGVGVILGLEKQKLQEGKDLIKFFCVPCKPTKANGNRTRNLPCHAPDKWEAFKEYNLRDVEVELAIKQKMAAFPVPQEEWRNYWLDQRINDTGIALDGTLVQAALRCHEQFREHALERARDITGLENPNSPVQMMDWLRSRGVEMETMTRDEVAGKAAETTGEVREALLLRLELAKSSVKKYEAMKNVVGSDGRARGLIQFYGANRTGRFAGRLVQVQNLPQNHLPDLEQARGLVRTCNFAALEFLYDSPSDVLKQLIRTAFVPKAGCRFIVADFSAIEARVIAWLAGESWRQEVFRKNGDIYCASATAMFHLPVVKHGINGHLRQKGKIAELACIAEGQPVLTDRGPVPIEQVLLSDRLWDGEQWVAHEGVACNGIKEVITYEGLTATRDHLVWVCGQPGPVRFGDAAACGAHLIQTGDGRGALRLGGDYQPRETVERENEPLLCTDEMYGMWIYPVAGPELPHQGAVEGLPALLPDTADTEMAGQASDRGQTAVRKPESHRLPKLRSAGHPVRFQQRYGSRPLPDEKIRAAIAGDGDRPDRYQRGLRAGEPPVREPYGKQPEQAGDRPDTVRAAVLAVQVRDGDPAAVCGEVQGRDYKSCGNSREGETEELAADPRKARVYDIRNAGRHHRFTVSGKLVHNCGYGGGIGALKNMGALAMGVKEEELPALITHWRESNPAIVRYWWDVDRAVKRCITGHVEQRLGQLVFSYEKGILFIRLPGGRRLAYVKPRIGTNRFGGESVTYEGIGEQKKWVRLESYGPKFVENIVQATSRDILVEAMQRLSRKGFRIVMHIHDEVVLEVPDGVSSVEEACAIMAEVPEWAEGLVLNADGYECKFYQKD